MSRPQTRRACLHLIQRTHQLRTRLLVTPSATHQFLDIDLRHTGPLPQLDIARRTGEIERQCSRCVCAQLLQCPGGTSPDL